MKKINNKFFLFSEGSVHFCGGSARRGGAQWACLGAAQLMGGGGAVARC
jgi:hypothetical protein